MRANKRFSPWRRGANKEPVCGCSRTFQDEHEIRHHLHDAYGLKDAIWRNPKPPRKRKCACNNESLNSPKYTGEERPKKSLFSYYNPPHLGPEDQLSNNYFVPALSVYTFIMVWNMQKNTDIQGKPTKHQQSAEQHCSAEDGA